MTKSQPRDQPKSSKRLASRRQRLSVWIIQDGKCGICGHDLEDRFEIDHIQPFSRKGPTDLWNLQAICIQCHKNKTKVDSSLEKDKNS